MESKRTCDGEIQVLPSYSNGPLRVQSNRAVKLESILQRNACVKGEGCDGILLESASNSETRWYRRYKYFMACP